MAWEKQSDSQPRKLPFYGLSMQVYVLQYLAQKANDQEIKPIIEYAQNLSEWHVENVGQIFKLEKFPIPKGFTNEDVNLNAPRLYSDTLNLRYVGNVSNVPQTWGSEVTGAIVSPVLDKLMMQQVSILTAIGMSNHGAARGATTRVDVAADFARLAIEIAEYGEDGIES
ncbi:hypothetical protein SPSIL_018330 [Sporomusa silvacetica DSM 10669]|uniref:Uncharacterized protein n=1 Tax=Sporomusa silvacetica DSM 10669 TaxID=1123289 RepID=A0ABZ3IJW2_9FIRM|nr:DUF3231 family protein [Sporomusa silvacetica]OZC18908.1 hypothetical protein SPSIL_25220 [Sporomusa silvacetica DSM 10669]